MDDNRDAVEYADSPSKLPLIERNEPNGIKRAFRERKVQLSEVSISPHHESDHLSV